MKLNDLEIAVLIIKSEAQSFSASAVIKEFGWQNEIPTKKVKRILKDVEAFRNGCPNSKLSRELTILNFLNSRFSINKFYNMRDFRWAGIDLNISNRQYRRYMKEINDSGYKLISRSSCRGGYRLQQPIKL